MGRTTLLIAVAILIVFLWMFVPYNFLNQHLPWQQDPEQQEQAASPPRSKSPGKALSAKVEVPYRKEEGEITFRLSDLKEKLRIDYEYDAQEGILTIRQGTVQLTMLREAPVLNRNGIYLPVEASPIIRDKEIRIPAVVVEEGLGRQVEVREEYALIEQNASVPALAETRRPKLPKGDPEGLIDYLSFLQTPIQGAQVSTKDSHLPGAERPYRNGVHEGLDYYSWTSRISIDSQPRCFRWRMEWWFAPTTTIRRCPKRSGTAIFKSALKTGDRRRNTFSIKCGAGPYGSNIKRECSPGIAI